MEWEIGQAVAVGPDGDVYVGGETHSSDFPTTAGSYHPVATPQMEDEFLLRLAPDGMTLRYSTLLGAPQGRWNGTLAAVAVDPQGRAYVVGNAFWSTDRQCRLAQGAETKEKACHDADAKVKACCKKEARTWWSNRRDCRRTGMVVADGLCKRG